MTKTEIEKLIDDWLISCSSRGKPSRNTIAAGIVVLHHLRERCPTSEARIFTDKGELIGARSALGKTLLQYSVPPKFLKEATTRQVATAARKLLEQLKWGKKIAGTAAEKDALLLAGLTKLADHAHAWLGRQHLKISCDRQESPMTWIGAIIEQAKGRSGGKVEQHLVGAKLERRFSPLPIANNPGHAGDVQTGRSGDFELGTTVYHVTAAPSQGLMEKCGANLASGRHPVILTPRANIGKAIHFAEEAALEKRVTIVSIEDFIALNIVEIAQGNELEFISTLQQIVEVYNRRLSEAETDPSLRIEIE